MVDGETAAALGVNGGSLKVCSFPSPFSPRASASPGRIWKAIWPRRSPRAGDYADLYFEYLLTSSISIDESMVKSAAQGVSMGVGVRVISGERTGYAYSDDLSPGEDPQGRPRRRPHRRRPSKVDKFDLNEGRRHNLYPVLTAPTETAFAERVELVKRADRAARAYDPRIFQVQAVYADNLRQVMVATSDGVLTLDRQPLARMSVSALARAERRTAAARPCRRRRTRGPRLFPERKDARALRRARRRAKPSPCWMRWKRRPAR